MLGKDEDFKGQRIPCVSTWYKAVDGCDVFYTHAYASYEKGPVENCNRIVRRRHPKCSAYCRDRFKEFSKR